MVAYDLGRSLGEQALAANPLRVNDSKLAIRERLLSAHDDAERFNPLHSSDDPRQALDYLALLDDPGIVTRLRRRIAEIHEQMAFPYPLVEVLPSLQRRAVTAVVRHPEHGECVCKLFYPGSSRFLERELRARTEFAGLPEAPALLESGPNYLLTPRYRDTGGHIRRTLPGMRHVQLTPRTSAAMGRLVRDLHERGAFLLDLSTQNLLTDEVDGLKVIDWEFLQDFSGDRPPIDRSPTILGAGRWRAGRRLAGRGHVAATGEARCSVRCSSASRRLSWSACRRVSCPTWPNPAWLSSTSPASFSGPLGCRRPTLGAAPRTRPRRR